MKQRAPSPSRSPSWRHTVADYFRMGADTDDRLEAYDGQVVAVSGGSVNHSRIVDNVGGELRSRLNGTPCQTCDPGLRVRVGHRRRYVHPDVTVVCGPVGLDPADSGGDTVANPRLVVEVLSPSNELSGRPRKAEAFRDVESLHEYLLVSQEQPRVEPNYRNADGVWSIGPAVVDPAASVALRSLGIELPLAEIYARVAFPPVADAAPPPAP